VPKDEPPRPSAEAGWFIARGGDATGSAGPFSSAELSAAWRSRDLRGADLVWREGWSGWVTAGSVFDLETPPVPRRHADALPLRLLAGVVCCFLVYFGAVARTGAGSGPALSAATAPAPGAAGRPFDLEICNLTESERVYVAIAYFDWARRDFVARGWYPQKRGDCRVAVQRLTPPVYVYAETKDGSARWGDEDEGLDFCIEGHGAFVLGQRGCKASGATASGAGALGDARGRRLQRFKRVQFTGSGSVHRWELTE
jgi:hypothetical protein